jgi:putative restriction endonuclease
VERDDDVRAACFLALDALQAAIGEELPYRDGLDRGFAFAGRRVPFLTYQKGIYRAAMQLGPAALSINTSVAGPYEDVEHPDGFLYAYRAGSVDQPDNRALRAAWVLQAPLVYFVGTRPGWYRPIYPAYVTEDRPAERCVLVTPGLMLGAAPVLPEERVERAYGVRETRARLHQARFRGLVIPAYRERCAVCRLRETRLLDAAHIVPDADPAGAAAVTNGLSLCTIHHRAFDQDLVAVAPDCTVHVSRRLREEIDGPMLQLLNGFHGTGILVPEHRARRPDPERLAMRFARFREREAA